MGVVFATKWREPRRSDVNLLESAEETKGAEEGGKEGEGKQWKDEKVGRRKGGRIETEKEG